MQIPERKSPRLQDQRRPMASMPQMAACAPNCIQDPSSLGNTATIYYPTDIASVNLVMGCSSKVFFFSLF